jgi:hypothetical protein
MTAKINLGARLYPFTRPYKKSIGGKILEVEYKMGVKISIEDEEGNRRAFFAEVETPLRRIKNIGPCARRIKNIGPQARRIHIEQFLTELGAEEIKSTAPDSIIQEVEQIIGQKIYLKNGVIYFNKKRSKLPSTAKANPKFRKKSKERKKR